MEGWRLLCPWAQLLGLIPHTNQARGASLSPTFPQTCLFAPRLIPLHVQSHQGGKKGHTLTSFLQTPICMYF